MNTKDIITIIYLIIPLLSFVFGLLESVEKQKRYGKSREESAGISKTVGILMGPPVLVQLNIVLLLDVFEPYVWKCIILVLAIGSLIFIVPRNFQTGLNSNRMWIPESIKKYQFTCLKISLYSFIVYLAFRLVISKWFQLL